MKLTAAIAALFTLFGMAMGQAPDLKTTLQTALDDERQARALYEAVMLKFGEVRPFSNIVHAESMHMKLVNDMMTKYEFNPEPDKFARKPKETREAFIARLEVPATFAAALRKAASLEKQQGPFYDRLSREAPEDVKALFARLKADSLDRHLAAFERSLGRGGGARAGRRGGPPPQ